MNRWNIEIESNVLIGVYYRFINFLGDQNGEALKSSRDAMYLLLMHFPFSST